MLRWLLLLAKVVLSGALVWYAFSLIDARSAMDYLSKVPLTVILLALVILSSEFIFAALRLRVLLSVLGAPCSTGKAADVVLIGAFFSQTLISFIGGDAMRIWRMAQINVPFGLATKGILFDRVAGFAGLIIISLLGLPWLFETVPQPAIRLGIGIALAVGVTGILGLFLTGLIPVALKRWKVFRWTSELSGVAFSILKNKSTLLLLVVLSVTIHMLNVFVLYLISLSLDMNIGFFSMLVLIPPVLLVSMLPISVAGWGVREGAMVAALNLVGAAPHQSLALSICFGLCVAAISLPGGALWFIGRNRPHAS